MASEAMRAGSALDARLWTLLTGHKVVWQKRVGRDFVLCPQDAIGAKPRYRLPGGRHADVEKLSSEWDAMGLVMDQMEALGWGSWEFSRRSADGLHFATFTSRKEGRYAMAGPHTGHDCRSLPHAVALAALAALEGRDG